MYNVIILVGFVFYISSMTWLSYYLAKNKTENPKTSAILGFFLAFLPPIAFLYLIILSLKDEIDTV